MKNRFLFLFLCGSFLLAQTDTDVYVLDLASLRVNPLNISKNPDYDNQPSFWDKDHLLFSSTMADQTDIVRYHLNNPRLERLTNTSYGSEYSPLRIPGSEDFSAIRLDTTGLQRLYRYDLEGKSQLLFSPLKIGYHRWVSSNSALCTVLVENRMDLVLADSAKSSKIIAKQVGRSIHAIPKTRLFSFIQQTEGQAFVNSYDPISNEITKLLTLPKGVQDIAWLPSGILIFGQGNTLYQWNSKISNGVEEWKKLEGIKNITRLAVSPNGQLLALVGEE
jgi:hypothetical protein